MDFGFFWNARIRLSSINNAWKYLRMQRMVYFEDDPCKGFPIAMVKVWSDVFLARTRATRYKTNMHCILPRQICHAEKQPIVQMFSISTKLWGFRLQYVPCGISFASATIFGLKHGALPPMLRKLTFLNRPQMRISLDSKIWHYSQDIGPSDVFNSSNLLGPFENCRCMILLRQLLTGLFRLRCSPTYRWWFVRNPAWVHQLRLVVNIRIVCGWFYHNPRWLGSLGISEPSLQWWGDCWVGGG